MGEAALDLFLARVHRANSTQQVNIESHHIIVHDEML